MQSQSVNCTIVRAREVVLEEHVGLPQAQHGRYGVARKSRCQMVQETLPFLTLRKQGLSSKTTSSRTVLDGIVPSAATTCST
jgi:hypothetical protein